MSKPEAIANAASDFDFLIGQWTVMHRRLKRRLAGDSSWIEFSGPASARKILNGLGNIDEYQIDLPGDPYTASTLRLFNPATGLWSLYWMDSRKLRARGVETRPLPEDFDFGAGDELLAARLFEPFADRRRGRIRNGRKAQRHGTWPSSGNESGNWPIPPRPRRL